jgi:hypothetical protein
VAYIGGVHLEEMNLLEVEFLRFLDWRLWVEPADYDFYGQGVLQHFAILEQQQQAALMQQQALLMQQ